MAELPSGTVAFLFTDVERHSELWEIDPDAMAAALEAHEILIADAVGAAGGRVVKNEGDAVMAVFADASAAVGAARVAQLALVDAEFPVVGTLRVRMGLHIGAAYERDGDYFGPTVIRAARLCDAAHGQQVVASEAVTVLAPSDWIDLGEHALRGLGAAERVHQLAGPRLRREFPPLRSVTSTQDRLPRPRTSFVGRIDELNAIARELERHRVVTLTGVGGSGKTRLAIEAARATLPNTPDGADFVDLSAVTDENDVYPAVAAALGLQAMEGTSEPPKVRVLAYLARRQSIVVIDNCEHLLNAVAGVVDDLTEGCDDLRILATSREALRVEDEKIIAVGSLDLEHDAISLFRDRATDAAADPVTVARICERLDGIPLAIELAAARTTHLSVEDVAARLDDRFRLLTGGRRRVQRQQTLQATLDWSYDLLTEEQRALLRRLAVFAAPFRLESVEGIRADEPFDVVDTLGALVERSMVTHDPAHGRYRLLETVRLYAEQKLFEAGETVGARQRHCEWFRSYVCDLPFEETFFECETSYGLVAELEDLRAAVRWSIETAEWEQAAEIACRLTIAEVFVDSNAVELWTTELVPRLDPGSDLTFRCMLAGVWNAVASGRRGKAGTSGAEFGGTRDLKLLESATRRLASLAEARSDDISIFARAFVAFFRDAIGWTRGDVSMVTAADELRTQAVEMASARPLSTWTGSALANVALVEMSRGHLADAAAMLRRCVDPDIEILRVECESALAMVLHVVGDPEALELAARAADRAELPIRTTTAACALALELAAGHDATGARQQLRVALAEGRRGSSLESTVLISGAGVAMYGDDYRSAARWLGSASAVGGIWSSPQGVMLYRHFVPLVRAALRDDEAHALRDEGRSLPLNDALDELADWIAQP